MTLCKQGLSPRVRGNLLLNIYQRIRLRSIPACAGEPNALRYTNYMKQVYPRVCGGTRNSMARGMGRKGLSPRVRGNPGRDGCECSGAGSIPACAGEPTYEMCRLYELRVYPRVCGGTVSYAA